MRALAEGYTEGEVGSGMRVSDTLPAENSNTRHFDEWPLRAAP